MYVWILYQTPLEIHFHEVWTDIFSGVLIFHGGFSQESGTVSST